MSWNWLKLISNRLKLDWIFSTFLRILSSLISRYDDMRSPLPQSISQMSLYNNSNNTSGNVVYQQSSGIIEPLPFHHNHRPVPLPSRSLISDYNPSSKRDAFIEKLIFNLFFFSLYLAYENLDGVPSRPPRKSWHVNV